ncbi:MAG: Calx-beta domain-containing protein, partial [Pleurocapsa sp.]
FRPSSGTLFVADGLDNTVYEISTSGTVISSFSTSNFGLSDPEGIGFDNESGNLFIVGEPTSTVFEVTTSGTLVQTIDISDANPVQPAGIGIAPSSDGSGRSIYIVDRGIDESQDINENDGKLYEFSLEDIDPGADPEISIADASIVEGNNGNTDLEFTVSLSEASTETVTVDFSTSDDTAIAGEDYLSSNGTISFDPGETTQTIALSIIGDTVAEEPVDETLLVNLTNASGATIVDGEATGTITDNDDGNPGGGGDQVFYATTRDSVNLNGNTFDDEDVIVYDPTTQIWSQYLDGSDLGLASNDIDGVHVNSDGSVLLSLNKNIGIEGIGGVDDSDILLFSPTSTGDNTAGSLELYFDGSDVGLDASGEDIDGISVASNGDILLSVNSSYNIGGILGQDEDILAFSPNSLGENTSGSFSLYIDGSDIGLTDGSEDIKGLSALSNGELALSTVGGFQVSGLSGGGSDLISFNPTSLGDDTSGSFSLLSSGAGNGLRNQVVSDISYGTTFDAVNPNSGGTDPDISIADASIVEGDNGNTDLEFTISLSEASTETVTIDFSTNDETAIAGEDYLSSNGTISFDPGETTQTIALSIIGDTVAEEPVDETLLVNLTNASGATIVDGEATGTITDNDDGGNSGGEDRAFYATTRDSVNLNGNIFDDEDVIFYDPTTQIWSQ